MPDWYLEMVARSNSHKRGHSSSSLDLLPSTNGTAVGCYVEAPLVASGRQTEPGVGITSTQVARKAVLTIGDTEDPSCRKTLDQEVRI